MDDVAALIGIRIRTMRKSKGMSQEKLAEKCGLHPTYIGQVERGEKNVTVNNVYRVAEALNVGLDEMFQGIGKKAHEAVLANELIDLLSECNKNQQKALIKIAREIVDFGKNR